MPVTLLIYRHHVRTHKATGWSHHHHSSLYRHRIGVILNLRSVRGCPPRNRLSVLLQLRKAILSFNESIAPPLIIGPVRGCSSHQHHLRDHIEEGEYLLVCFPFSSTSPVRQCQKLPWPTTTTSFSGLACSQALNLAARSFRACGVGA